MGLLDKLLGKKETSLIKGEIGYFGLSEWWLSEFSESERDYILKIFQPLGFDKSSLTESYISYTSGTPIKLLSALSGYFKKKEDRTIAYRMLKKAEELINDSSNILDVHFLYQQKMKTYYNNRENDSNALGVAIESCKQQIKISGKAKVAFEKEYKGQPLPVHIGFKQLAIIEEKNKNYESVIKICEEALKQGWNGDWEKRIEKCKGKI